LIQETANENTTAMKDRAAAAPLGPVGDLTASPWKCFAPVPAATHQTTNGEIQRKASRRWIHEMPRTQIIHTVVQIIRTPAHWGHFPSESAVRTDAPEMLFIAFQPVVETMEKITTRRLPQ
jgi:hypothetical protein